MAATPNIAEHARRSESRPIDSPGGTRRLLITAVALGGSGATTLGFNLLIPHALSPGSFGDVARVFSLSMAVAQLGMASVAPGLAWYVGRRASQAERENLAPSAATLIALSSVALGCLFAPLALAGLAPHRPSDLILGVLQATIYGTYFGLKMQLFALGRSLRYARLEITSDITFFLALLVFYRADPGLAIGAFVIAYGLFLALAAKSFRRRSGRGHIPITRDLLRYGGLTMAGTYASASRFPLVVLLAGAIGASSISARVAAMVALLAPLFLLPQAAGILTFADVARAAGTAVPQIVRRSTRTVAACAGAAAAVAAVAAHPVLRHLLPTEYSRSIDGFVIVSAAFIPLLAATPASNALAADGLVLLSAKISVAGLASALIATAVLLPPFGVAGVIAALAIAGLVQGTLAIAAGTKHYGVAIGDYAAGITAGSLGLISAYAPLAAPARIAVALAAIVLAASSLMLLRKASEPSLDTAPR